MSEKFAFDQIGGSAAQLIETKGRSARLLAACRGRLCRQPLAVVPVSPTISTSASLLATVRICRRNGFHFRTEPPQAVHRANQRSYLRPATAGFFKASGPQRESSAHRIDQTFWRVGLFDEIIAPVAHHADCQFQVAMSGDKDHGKFRVFLQGRRGNSAVPIHTRHADVGHEDAGKNGRDPWAAHSPRGRNRRVQIGQFQRLLRRRCAAVLQSSTNRGGSRSPVIRRPKTDGASASLSVTLNTAPRRMVASLERAAKSRTML